MSNLYFSGFILTKIEELEDRHKKTARKLAESEDSSVLGLLTETLEFKFLSGYSTRPASPGSMYLENEFVERLSKVTSSYGALLNDEHRKSLRRVLHKSGSLDDSYYTEIQIAILKALEQIGTEDDLRIVTQIVSDSKYYDPKIKEAALECLPLLQLRASKGKRKGGTPAGIEFRRDSQSRTAPPCTRCERYSCD